MNAGTKHLGFTIVLAGSLVICSSCTSRVVNGNHIEAMPKEELILNLEEAVATLDNFRGKVALTSVGDGKSTNIVFDVVSKGENLLYVNGKLNGEPSLSFVIKGDRGWMLPEPGGKLDTMTSPGTAVTSHPSMQSFLSGVLYGLKHSEFVSSAKQADSGRLHVLIKATDPESEWLYELDPKTFLVLKQHACGPHWTGNATWTAIDLKTTVREDFFDRKLQELKRMAGDDSARREAAQPQAGGD